MKNAGDLRWNKTADETWSWTFFGKFVGQVGNFPNCIRHFLVRTLQFPELVNGSDLFPSPVGQLGMHHELIEVKLVLLLKVIGLVIIFAV